MDLKIAFFNIELKELQIFIVQLPGFVVVSIALFGFANSTRPFMASKLCPHENGFILILIIYVDDLQLVSTFSHSELTPFHDETKEKAMWPSPP